ncbi:hypothetical protein HK096_004662 [Nowakowskiella sp. JEL0078]|nr:hypothetical protein HK096_004662 [Nowakowskiella sp. JEL0078]
MKFLSMIQLSNHVNYYTTIYQILKSMNFGVIDIICFALIGSLILSELSILVFRKRIRLKNTVVFLITIFTLFDFCVEILLITQFATTIARMQHEKLADIEQSPEVHIFRPLLGLIIVMSTIFLIWGLYTMISMVQAHKNMKKWFRRHFLMTMLAVFLCVCNPSILAVFSKQVWKDRRAMPMPKFDCNKLSTSAAVLLVIRDFVIAITLWSIPSLMQSLIPFTVFIICIICIILFTVVPLMVFFTSRLLKPSQRGRDTNEDIGNRHSTGLVIRSNHSLSTNNIAKKKENTDGLKELEDILCVSTNISADNFGNSNNPDCLWEAERSAWKKRRLILAKEILRFDNESEIPASLFIGRNQELQRTLAVINGFISNQESKSRSRCVYIEGVQGEF